MSLEFKYWRKRSLEIKFIIYINSCVRFSVRTSKQQSMNFSTNLDWDVTKSLKNTIFVQTFSAQINEYWMNEEGSHLEINAEFVTQSTSLLQTEISSKPIKTFSNKKVSRLITLAFVTTAKMFPKKPDTVCLKQFIFSDFYFFGVLPKLHIALMTLHHFLYTLSPFSVI